MLLLEDILRSATDWWRYENKISNSMLINVDWVFKTGEALYHSGIGIRNK